MNSLTTHYRRSQLIALPLPGGKAKVEYCYAVNVPGESVRMGLSGKSCKHRLVSLKALFALLPVNYS